MIIWCGVLRLPHIQLEYAVFECLQLLFQFASLVMYMLISAVQSATRNQTRQHMRDELKVLVHVRIKSVGVSIARKVNCFQRKCKAAVCVSACVPAIMHDLSSASACCERVAVSMLQHAAVRLTQATDQYSCSVCVCVGCRCCCYYCYS
jgi:hypothetical protein